MNTEVQVCSWATVSQLCVNGLGFDYSVNQHYLEDWVRSSGV